MPPTSRWSISTERSGAGKAQDIEGLAIVDELQFQLLSVELLAAKFDVAESIAITVPANIGHYLFDHQLDFVHAGDGKARFLRLRRWQIRCSALPRRWSAPSVRAVVTGAAIAGYLSPYTAAAAGEIAASASRTVG